MDNKKDQHKEKKLDENSEEIVQEENKDEVAHLKNQILECEDKYKRALADYQNLERRSQEQKKNG